MLLEMNKLICPCSHTNNVPWIAGDEYFGEANHVGTVAGGVLDETNGFLNAALEVLPDGLGLNGGDFESLGHVEE